MPHRQNCRKIFTVEPDAEKNEIYAKSELSRQDLTSLKDVGLMVSNPHRGFGFTFVFKQPLIVVAREN